jgi:anthranilate synthase component 2
LIIDNYDSFVYNLAQYVGSIGAKPRVSRNDHISLEQIDEFSPERIIISPGPGSAVDNRYFGVCKDVLTKVSTRVPTLGVCLGHQGIAHTFGGKIGKAKKIMHGKTSRIAHDGKSVLVGLDNPLQATRYHSLVVEKEGFPNCLKVTAVSLDDAEIMGLRHKKYPIEGIQFHPESFMTPSGKKIIQNFIEGGVEV